MGRSSKTARRTRGILGGRSEHVVRRVLDAAIAELARSGFHGFRMDVVATRAAVNKTTIYRRWPDRAALVTALVDRMRAPLASSPLPDTGQLESDLVEAFARRFTFGRRTEGKAWARLLEERYRPEVEAIIGATVAERRDEWRAMVSRGIERNELPPRTDVQLVLELVRAIVDSRRASGTAAGALDRSWLILAVRTVLAGARAGVLVRVGAPGQREAKGRARRSGRAAGAARRTRRRRTARTSCTRHG